MGALFCSRGYLPFPTLTRGNQSAHLISVQRSPRLDLCSAWLQSVFDLSQVKYETLRL